PGCAVLRRAASAAGLGTGGARAVTAAARGGSNRRAELGCSVYLRPTVIHCDAVDHPLANTEYMFPYTSVVEVPQDRMLEVMGPSLVVTALTKDPAFLSHLTTTPLISRLNVGPVPTSKVEWDQPHEGNLFEFLYERRALQRAAGW
ncbi:MAG: aldehyde dehydrogenase, partial [Planctomycetota bacterium]